MKIGEIKKGSRVKVFDHRLFIDDESTPLSITMKAATVIKCHPSAHNEEETLVDVEFDYRPGEISRCHFIWGIESL